MLYITIKSLLCVENNHWTLHTAVSGEIRWKLTDSTIGMLHLSSATSLLKPTHPIAMFDSIVVQVNLDYCLFFFLLTPERFTFVYESNMLPKPFYTFVHFPQANTVAGDVRVSDFEASYVLLGFWKACSNKTNHL